MFSTHYRELSNAVKLGKQFFIIFQANLFFWTIKQRNDLKLP